MPLKINPRKDRNDFEKENFCDRIITAESKANSNIYIIPTANGKI